MLQLLWHHRLPLLLLAAYWAVALGLYLRWERENWYPTTGDEPHHIAVGRSVLRYGTFEMTPYHVDLFARQGRTDVPRDGADHLQSGPNGLFSVRPIGTGLTSIPAIALSDAAGYHNDILFIRASFVLLSGLAVLAVWVLSSLYIPNTGGRVLAVLLCCFSLPLLIAANQTFPDMPAGVLGLSALAYIAWRNQRLSVPIEADIAAIAAVTWIPLLHYKLAIMAVVLACAIALVVYRQTRSFARMAGMSVVPIVAATGFFYYNYVASGDIFRTPSEVESSLSVGVRWMFTFSLDRWHGFLLQNPAVFIGVLFFVPFLRRHPVVAIPALLCYLTAMGINAAHGSPGFSFAGRHAWTGALMMVPAVIYGVGCIEAISKRALYGLGGVLIALQVVAIVPLLRSDHDLTNQPAETWFDVYPSFFPEALNRFLPAIYHNDWWSGFAINYVYIAFAAALFLIGAIVYPRRRDLTLPAAGGLLAVALPLVVLVSLVQGDPPREPRRWLGSQMHRNFGIVLPRTVQADVDMHSAGIRTFGPYMKVAPGDYRVTFVYSADAPPDVKVGSWDVIGRAGRVRFAEGDLYGSNGLRAVATDTLTVESRADGESFEMRTRFDDVADLLLGEIVLEPAD